MRPDITRGSVWWVDLGEPRGSAPALIRPAVVVSADTFNRSRIRTVVVVTITSNLRLGDAPGNVRLSEGEAGLAKPAVVNVSQVVTLDKTNLVDRVGELSRPRLAVVDDGMRLVLAL